LIFEEKTEQRQFAHTYRLVTHSDFGYVLEKKTEDGYKSLYAFTPDACRPEDFLMSNHFTATYPESFFLTMRMCTMPTKDGRVTLTDDRLRVVENNRVSDTPIVDDSEFKAVLKEQFDLDLDLIKPG
jgi:N-hydroxyarylamine O-acetyltransferase